jgi:hypothetical protein
MAFVQLTPQVLTLVLAPLKRSNPAICLATLNKEKQKVEYKKIDGLDRTYAQFVAGFAAAMVFVQERLMQRVHKFGVSHVSYAWLKGLKHAAATCK